TGVMSRIVREDVVPDAAALPRADYPGLPAVVLKALAKDPAERYQNLELMRDALEALVRQAAPRLLARERETGPRPPAAEEATRLATDVERARGAGQLLKALHLCARLRELDPPRGGGGRGRATRALSGRRGLRASASPRAPARRRSGQPRGRVARRIGPAAPSGAGASAGAAAPGAGGPDRARPRRVAADPGPHAGGGAEGGGGEPRRRRARPLPPQRVRRGAPGRRRR